MGSRILNRKQSVERPTHTPTDKEKETFHQNNGLLCSPPLSLRLIISVSQKSVLGGFRAQGRTAVKARQVVEDALAVQEAGAFAVVVECVPSPVAKAVTEALEIPTIGIGAGPFTSGQVGRLEFFVVGGCRNSVRTV